MSEQMLDTDGTHRLAVEPCDRNDKYVAIYLRKKTRKKNLNAMSYIPLLLNMLSKIRQLYVYGFAELSIFTCKFLFYYTKEDKPSNQETCIHCETNKLISPENENCRAL
ncbi:hypothetical protein CRM22_002452 [Opisthorchis felineus]|uniref:Uncharacterized protein n=1 Tax=Opisthorchis felineus TaxID=147828 RepID=A0A4S2M5Z0_OPIFE|nr:hypothetical protein CRM22_002452 [Opisthorchis felineus]